MGLQDDFVGSATTCMNPNFKFPSINEPGMPNFFLGCFLATTAGIGYILDFIPPTPAILPKIKPPTIAIFLDAFMSGIKLPASYPGISVGPLTIPGVGNPPYKYDLSGEMKLMTLSVLLPYYLITDMVKDLLELKISIPTLGMIISKIEQIAVSIGLPAPILAKFGGCLASSVANLFSSMI